MIQKSPLIGLNWFGAREVEFRGAFGGEYRVGLTPTPAQAEWGMIFAGQGAAHPGMLLDQYRRPEIRSAYARADRCAAQLGLPPISAHILSPESTDPKVLSVQNHSLFTLEVGLFDGMLARGIFPRALTSHSFGEYAMLVAAGVLPFEEMFAVVAYRESISPPANERGFLVAVNADRDQTGRLLQGKNFHFSNFNSPSQTVVAVAPADVEALEGGLKDRGVKFKRLATPQPYHSPLLLSLKPQMRKWLRSRTWTVSPPLIPFFSSVLSRRVDASTFQTEDLFTILENQVVEKVDFIRQIQGLVGEGVERFIEIGPTSLLGTLARDCGARECQWVVDRLSPRTAKEKTVTVLSPKAGKILGLVNEVIGRITGYKIEEISLEDRFQEDLGIDSIKKTEILFSVMDRLSFRPEGEVNYSRFTRVEDLVGFLETAAPAKEEAVGPKEAHFDRYTLEWTPQPLDRAWRAEAVGSSPLMIPLTPRDLLAEGDPAELAGEFLRQFQECGTRQVLLVASNFAGDMGEIADGSLGRLVRQGLPRAAAVVRECLKGTEAVATLQLGLVTTGPGNPITEAMAAFFKSLCKEHPGMRFKHIRLTDPEPRVDALRWIREELEDPLTPEVRYEGDTRYVPRWVPVGAESGEGFREGSVVLAVGGAKGITVPLLESLPPARLYLCGRSSEDEVAPQLDHLRSFGHGVTYRTVDATHGDELQSFVEFVLSKEASLDVVLHAAGVEVSRALVDKTDQEVERELFSKALSALHLIRSFGEHPPKRLLFFSSVVSWYGNPGQTIYGASNAFLDRLCPDLNAAWGAGVASSVLWPPWDGVGMTAQGVVRQSLAQRGLSLLAPARAQELFRQEFTAPEPKCLYWDPSDEGAYGLGVQPGFPELLGRGESLRSGIRYRRAMSEASDPGLGDHRIEGLIYVPAAYGLAGFLGASYLKEGRWCGLRNFSASAPLIVGEKGSELVWELGDLPRMTLTNETGSFSAERELALVSIPEEPSVDRAEKISADQLYGADRLFHGPTFQPLSRVYVDPQGGAVTALSGSSEHHVPGGTFWGRWVLWIDAAFQMTALLELRANGSYSLPVAVGCVVPGAMDVPAGRVRLTVSSIRCDGEKITSQAHFVDESGRCLLYLEGITMALVRRQPVARAG